ncbi:MAG: hypothetical protein A2600_13025 [Candidatus Lambdaproteobacteria bacterium RIFOXYD1_FULL_56_27]|uniref:Uncharacterized protein n=1 Tax=Candidatus Lambdaproteobacteria bacterium RIFOXYD2_FULL_56_26 TaxID=1817773 RepID=A0A1F6GL61_9PROT|nr:MAG: hypothetical protein A2557_13200 [Candidatus Lambdaproteobacteria bacterium RIFOXYD2_FULL_56_26]OGH03570.1 MAG: hypothetical protein A2426_06385 [Candidatus Lambdaproteobacteria bacterium RIFOXYC1_FULL_56_13]OGH08942.1 MAG: hypothetical protein A2600_13025 [Candidatus Lambdaproteobacteria bacterium RIFOXYD1_FULL_56_27]
MSENAPKAKPYWPNLAAGIGLGLVLLTAYFISGRGLGGSGAVARVTAGVMNIAAPEHVRGLSLFSGYFRQGLFDWTDWLIFQTIGVFLGGFVAAVTAGRFAPGVEKGPQVSRRQRFGYSLLGGAIMGIGARIAKGCTSGQGLSGGATLALGSWVFLLGLFVGGFVTAIFFKRLWQ